MLMGATTWSWQLLQKHFNYHGALETSPQDKRGMNCLRVNAQIFFCVGTIIEGLFIISIIKWCQTTFNLTDKGKKFLQTGTVLWGNVVRCSVGKQKSKETRQSRRIYIF